MVQCRQDPPVVRGVSVIPDLRVCGAVKFDNGNIVPSRRAHRLGRRVYRLDGPRIAGREVCIHGCRIGSERCNFHAQHWIAGHDVHEATAIAMPYSKDPSSVDAVGIRQIGNQVLDKPDIVNERIRPTR